MNITDEIVEVGAKALDDHEFPGEGWESESSSGFWRSVCRDRARAALEAAAPLIAAQAWDEGYAEGGRGRMWDSTNPYCTNIK